MFSRFKKKKANESSGQDLSPEADQFMKQALAEFQTKREALLNGEWKLSSCSDWGFDPEAGVLMVVFADGSQ